MTGRCRLVFSLRNRFSCVILRSVNEELTKCGDSCSAWADDRLFPFLPNRRLKSVAWPFLGFRNRSRLLPSDG